MRPDNKEWKCRTIMEEVLTETATKLKPTLQGVETKTSLYGYAILEKEIINRHQRTIFERIS